MQGFYAFQGALAKRFQSPEQAGKDARARARAGTYESERARICIHRLRSASLLPSPLSGRSIPGGMNGRSDW